MANATLFQTFSKSGGNKTLPVYCQSSDAWLSKGYYFWDTLIDNAHWWGRVHYSNCYHIGKTTYDKTSPLILDLLGDLETFLQFKKVTSMMREYLSVEQLKVGEVIAYIKELQPNAYKAVRACPINANKEERKDKLLFNDSHCAYMSMMPNVQVCVFDLSFLASGFEIIYTS